MNRVMRVVGQGAAVPHRGLSYIQDLITYCLLVVVVVVVGGVRSSQKERRRAPPRVPERGRGEVEELIEGGRRCKGRGGGGRWVQRRDRKEVRVSSEEEKEVIR